MSQAARPTLLDVLSALPQPPATLSVLTGLSLEELACEAQQAQSYGVPLLLGESGYALEPGTPAPGLVARAAGQEVGRYLRYVAHTDSTQNEVRRYAQQLSAAGQNPHGAALVAQAQSHGRGRRGRAWHGEAQSLLLSVLLQGPAAGQLATLPLTCAVALRQACGGSPWQLKWPNDLLSPDGRKAAGILVEAQWRGSQPAQVVVGIGVNVRPPAAGTLQSDLQPAYLQEYSNLSRAQLLERLLERLDYWTRQPVQEVLTAWQAASQMLGRTVTVTLPTQKVTGTVLGLGAAGELLLEIAGACRSVTAGEVSLIGTLGELPELKRPEVVPR